MKLITLMKYDSRGRQVDLNPDEISSIEEREYNTTIRMKNGDVFAVEESRGKILEKINEN